MKLPQTTAAHALAVACLVASATGAAGSVSVELAAEGNPLDPAPRQWLARLADAGAGFTRLASNGAARGPRIETLGERNGRPLVKLYAVVDSRGDLLLPGPDGSVERFRAGDALRLAEYFARLEADGPAAVTSARGPYGLTRADFEEVFRKLARSTPRPRDEEPTIGDRLEAARRVTGLVIDIDRDAKAALSNRALDATKFEGFSVGTSLAATLRQEGLAFSPKRPPGQPLVLHVHNGADGEGDWPVGYKPERPTSRTAPMLMERLPVEVEGFTLAEAIDAIAPRLTVDDAPLPVLFDWFTARREGIEPTAKPVRVSRTTMSYKQLIDTLAFQGRLNAKLRVDEAGRPFVWLTR